MNPSKHDALHTEIMPKEFNLWWPDEKTTRNVWTIILAVSGFFGAYVEYSNSSGINFERKIEKAFGGMLVTAASNVAVYYVFLVLVRYVVAWLTTKGNLQGTPIPAASDLVDKSDNVSGLGSHPLFVEEPGGDSLQVLNDRLSKVLDDFVSFSPPLRNRLADAAIIRAVAKIARKNINPTIHLAFERTCEMLYLFTSDAGLDLYSDYRERRVENLKVIVDSERNEIQSDWQLALSEICSWGKNHKLRKLALSLEALRSQGFNGINPESLALLISRCSTFVEAIDHFRQGNKSFPAMELELNELESVIDGIFYNPASFSEPFIDSKVSSSESLQPLSNPSRTTESSLQSGCTPDDLNAAGQSLCTEVPAEELGGDAEICHSASIVEDNFGTKPVSLNIDVLERHDDVDKPDVVTNDEGIARRKATSNHSYLFAVALCLLPLLLISIFLMSVSSAIRQRNFGDDWRTLPLANQLISSPVGFRDLSQATAFRSWFNDSLRLNSRNCRLLGVYDYLAFFIDVKDNAFIVPLVELGKRDLDELRRSDQKTGYVFLSQTLPYRKWSDTSGSYEVRARLSGLSGNVGFIEDSFGSLIAIPIFRLSSIDVDYIGQVYPDIAIQTFAQGR